MAGNRPFIIAAILLVLGAGVLPERALASSRNGWGWTRSGSRAWSFGLEASVRAISHYNQEESILTPPRSILAEGHLNAWYKKTVALYFAYGKSIGQADSSLFGGGIKFPFLTFSARSKGISGISLLLIADLVYYTIVAPTPPKIYTPDEFLFRYGGGIHWGISSSGFYLNSTMMITQHSGNFVIAPQLGLGFNF